MFESLSLKIKSVGGFMKTHQYLVLVMACAIVLIIIAVFSLTQIFELKMNLNDSEERIAEMTVRMAQWEQAASENEVLIAENAVLTAENDSVIATNSELERQNGELLKKFDGLSKPQ